MNGTEIALIITAILGGTGLWGASSLLKKDKKEVTLADLPQATVDPQTAVLKAQVEALTGLLLQTVTRVESLEAERDAAVLSQAHADAIAEDAARKEALAAEYVLELRHHINEGKQPPPPDWPPGWVHR